MCNITSTFISSMSMIAVLILTSVFLELNGLSNLCDGHVSDSDLRTILSGRYTPCRFTDNNYELLVCEIQTEDDQSKINKMVSSCYQNNFNCGSGIFNSTCIPLLYRNNLKHRCFCRLLLTDPMDTLWSEWTKLTTPRRTYLYTRQLHTVSVDSCTIEEYTRRPPVYIIDSYALPDNVYSASSVWNNNFNLNGPQNARINYLGDRCAWLSDEGDILPWIQMTLPETYVIQGAVIYQRCNSNVLKYAQEITIAHSIDNNVWNNIISNMDIENLYSSYDGYGFVKVMFGENLYTRFWKIYIIRHTVRGVKCDLVGYQL